MHTPTTASALPLTDSRPADAPPAAAGVRWPDDPYKGLAYYEAEDEGLFAGRSVEVDECAQLLSHLDTRLLILHGQTGCGKSSFLRAGLIPALERNGNGYFFLRRRSRDERNRWVPSFIRCGANPLARIAEEIWSASAEPIPVRTATGSKDIDLTPARLGHASIESFLEACAHPTVLRRSLGLLTRAVPHTLVLILDQVEEVLTLNRTDSPNITHFARLVKETATSDLDLRLVLTVRKDHSGQLMGSIQIGNAFSSSLRTYFLGDLTRAGMADAIRRPTLEVLPDAPEQPGPRSRYGFEFAPEVVEALLDDLDPIPSGATLPVMQIVCRELYRQVETLPAPRRIEMHLYQQGGLAGRVQRHLCNTLASALDLPLDQADAGHPRVLQWLRVLKRFVQEEGDGRVHTGVVPRKTVDEWASSEHITGEVRRIVDILADPEVMVLRTFSIAAPGTGTGHEFMSLGHDTIGIAIVKALHDQEARQWVQRKLRRASWRTLGLTVGTSALLIGLTWVQLSRWSAANNRIDSLLTLAAGSRSNDVMAAIGDIRLAAALGEETVLGRLLTNRRVERAAANLLGGLPVVVSADPADKPLGPDSTIFPTYALPAHTGFAAVGADGVLSIRKPDADGGLRSQRFDAVAPLRDSRSLTSLEFSEQGQQLTLALYRPSDPADPGGVIAYSANGSTRVFSHRDLLALLPGTSTVAAPLQLFGVNGNRIHLFALSRDDTPVMTLNTLTVTEALGLGEVVNQTMKLPTPYLIVKDRLLVSVVYGPSPSTATAPAIERLESRRIAEDAPALQWRVDDFAAVRECSRQPQRRCDVAAVPNLNQTPLVVLGLTQVWNERDGQRRTALTHLLVIDPARAGTLEIDLRSVALARQQCDRGFADPATPAPLVLERPLREDDVPAFLVLGPRGPLVGFVANTAAQLVDVSAAPKTCRELFFPAVDLAGWTTDAQHERLYAVTRDAGYVWDVAPPAAHATAAAWRAGCAKSLTRFVGRPEQLAARQQSRRHEIEAVCPSADAAKP